MLVNNHDGFLAHYVTVVQWLNGKNANHTNIFFKNKKLGELELCKPKNNGSKMVQKK